MPRLSAPRPNLEELDLSSLLLYDIAPLDQQPGPSSSETQPKPSASQPPATPLALFGQPSWTQQQPQQPQPTGAQNASHNLRLCQIRPPIEITCLNKHPVMTNFTLHPAIFVRSQNAGAVRCIDSKNKASGAIPSRPMYHPCCIGPQPLPVYQQPSPPNLVLSAVSSSVTAPPQEDPGRKEATAEDQPQVEAQTSNEDEGKSKMLQVISPLCLDEETLKERAFEEYNAIMDSLDTEDEPQKDYLLEELFKVDEMFLEYLDELCGDRDFVRNVGATLNMDYWNSLVSSDQAPIDLLAQETKQQEQENLPQKTLPNECSAPLAEAPPNCPNLLKYDQNPTPDGDVPLTDPNKEYEEELLNAIAAITGPDEAQNNGEYNTPTSQDYYSASPWETGDWPRLNTEGQRAFEFDPAAGGVCPVGSSPLLPSHILELLQATPDSYMTTFSSPFDEAIYMNFTSPPDPSLNSSTSLSSDLSAADLETLAEILLQDDSKEEPSYVDWETVQPKLGFSSPLPLNVLSLQVILNLDKPSQPGKDAGDEVISHELNSFEGVPVSMWDVSPFSSPVLLNAPWTGLESSFENIPSSEVCRNLEPEMVGEGLQNPLSNQNVLRQEEQQGIESFVEERRKDAFKSNNCVFSMRRSQRLSHEHQEVGSFEKIDKILHMGNGACEVNAKKIDTLKETEPGCQEKRGRGEQRKTKIAQAGHTINVVKRRTRSMVEEADVKTRCGAIPRWRSSGGGARGSQNRDQTSRLKEEKAVRDLLQRGKGQMLSPTKRCRQEGWDFKRNDREMNKTHKCSPKKKPRELSANEGNCKASRSKTGKRHVKTRRNSICEDVKMTAKPPTTNKKAVSKRRRTSRKQKFAKLPEKYRDFVTCQTKAAKKRPKKQQRWRKKRRNRAK